MIAEDKHTLGNIFKLVAGGFAIMIGLIIVASLLT